MPRRRSSRSLTLFDETGIDAAADRSPAPSPMPRAALLSGQTAEAFWNSVRHAQPLFVGLNCALGGRQLRPVRRGAVAPSPTPTCAPIRTPACRTPSASTTSAPAETAEILREFARGGLVNIVGGCCGTTPEHIRAAARPGSRGCAPRAPAGAAARKCRLSGLEPLNIDARQPVRQRRRAHQRHRLGEVPQADRGRRLRRPRWTWRASRSTSGAQIIDVNMDEGMLDSEAAMVRFLNLIAAEPDIARVPVMIDSSKWSVIEAGPEVRAGQGDRQLDQPQGGRGGVPRARAQGAPLRRRRGGHGLRRAGPGRHRRAQGGDLRARLPPAHRAGRAFRPRTSSSIRTSSPSPPASRSTTTTALDFIEATRRIKQRAAARAGQRRRQQRVVLVPRQRPGARGDALGVPVPRHRRRHGHGHRQRRPAGRLRADRSRSCARRART